MKQPADSLRLRSGGIKHMWCLIVIFFVSIGFVSAIIFRPYHPFHKLFLDYLSTILSWPFVFLLFVLILCWLFRDQLSVLLGKVSEVGFGNAYAKIGGQPPMDAKAVQDAAFKGQARTESIGSEGLPPRFEDIPQPYQALARTYIDWIIYERLIRMMFRSQFELLRSLSAKGFLPGTEVDLFYKLYLKRGGNPEYTQDAYVGWLLNIQLAEAKSLENRFIGLSPTKQGKGFIDYFYLNRYPESEFRDL